jgi:ABC-type lipoprotein export system ATPase subunit
MSGRDPLILGSNLRRIYPPSTIGDLPLDLRFPDVIIGAGRRIALLGVSGSGKSTLLNLIAGLDACYIDNKHPPSIVYRFSDGAVADMAGPERFPRDRLGFVFQEGHLITDVAAGVNAALPGMLNGIPGRDADISADMDALDLPPGAAGREVWRLSGGQKQRVAILRALFHQPQIIFADEPTSSLDKRTAAAIMKVLVQYQQADPHRTLFWATHDLPLAAEFASDFLIVRKLAGERVELEGPIANLGPQHLSEIEAKVYDGVPVSEVRPLSRLSSVSKTDDEIGYTQAKVGSSLTFARRGANRSLIQVGPLGRWMASIESRPPPLLKGFFSLFQLYRRFSDQAVAGSTGLSVLMLAFVFLGLATIAFFRDQAMSDPAACNIVAAAAIELTPSLITVYNNEASWRGAPRGKSVWSSFASISPSNAKTASANPCGEAPALVFGRNARNVQLYMERGGRCEPIASPKSLVANLAEPAILETRVVPGGGRAPQRLAELIPQGRTNLQSLSTPPLTGEEIFVTEGFREQLNREGVRDLPKDITDLPLCVPEAGGRRLHIGGVISGLPQPRGLPYAVLLAHGSPLLMPTDSYEQAVFYTHPENAEKLGAFLKDKEFAFSRDELERMIAASTRFNAIQELILIVGGIMLVSTFFFLLTSIRVFLEKDARPNAVLRAYGLTRKILVRQIFWRLGAISLYALSILTLVGMGLGLALFVLFQQAGLPLPSLGDVISISLTAIAVTVVGVFMVVHLAVWLWWRRHGNIAQELN